MLLNFYLKGYGGERGKRAKKLPKSPRRALGYHVLGPVGRTGGPKKKSFQGGKFDNGGFNIFQGKISISKGTAVRGEKGRKKPFLTCRPNGWPKKNPFRGEI